MTRARDDALAAELSATLRDFLAHKAEPILPVVDADPLWPRLCTELGVGGLLVPDGCGGLDLGPPEVAAVAAQLGRVLDGGPFLPSAVSATAALAAVPAVDQHSGLLVELLVGLATGSRTACLAHDPFGTPRGRPAAGSASMSPAAAGDIGPDPVRVTGEIGPFLAVAQPDVLVVPVVDGGQEALAVVTAAAPGVHLELLTGLDLSRSAARVRFHDAQATVVARGPHAVQAVTAAETATMIALGAECVGVADHALEMTVDYLRDRRQFGRVVGSFQAVKHQLADLAVIVEVARSAQEFAVRDHSDPRITRAAAHTLMATAPAAAVAVTTEAIQLHGGIGFTWEHPAHRLLRRAHTAAALFGTPARHHRELYALLETEPDLEGPR